MGDNFRCFLETLEVPNTKRVVNSLQAIGDYDYTNCTPDELEQIVLSMNPNSPRAIITICYVIGLYARYLKDDRLYNMTQDVNKSALWLMAKPNASKKFLSHSSFEEVYHDMGVYEEFNALYYQTLFKCVYEGIYNDDMSVLKNLRSSDIDKNVITLHEDNGHSYKIEVPEQLAEDLKELAFINVWDRRNNKGISHMKISGVYYDSCFKVEKRKTSSEYSYRYSYYRVLRKISKDYLEYSLLPLQLYVSGIMHRINIKLKENNISLEDAFADHNRDRLVNKIISDELARCNYNIEVRNFRQIVRGHLDVFST